MSIQVRYGAGNSQERLLSGRTTVEHVITDPRMVVSLGFPSDPNQIEARRNGVLLSMDSPVNEGDTLNCSKKSNTKG